MHGIVTAMGRFCVLSIAAWVTLAACGGAQIPEHNGYKTTNAKPWKKAKTLKFDEKFEAKAEGDLSYPDMRRAAWFAADLPQTGDLDVSLEITPPGDAVNDNFDLGMEVLDPGNRSITRWDLEEGGDAGELKKVKNLKELTAGKYLVHLYLQGRLDTADYVLRVVFHPTSAQLAKSDFPSQVPFVPALPVVPISDDTPKSYHPPTTTIVSHTVHHQSRPAPPPPPPAETLSARIIGLQVVSGGTQITVGRGTSGGAQAGMKGKISGIPNGTFTLAACTERTCTATVSATPDQIKSSGQVEISH